jgi:hypothetical protein
MSTEMSKTLVENVSKNVQFVEDSRGSFDIVPGGRSGTPPVTLKQVTAGDIIKVTCVLNTLTKGGFYYRIQGQGEDTDKLSTGLGVVGYVGHEFCGWAGTSRIDFFKAKEDGDASFEVDFEQNDLDGQGRANSFMLIAENLGT